MIYTYIQSLALPHMCNLCISPLEAKPQTADRTILLLSLLHTHTLFSCLILKLLFQTCLTLFIAWSLNVRKSHQLRTLILTIVPSHSYSLPYAPHTAIRLPPVLIH